MTHHCVARDDTWYLADLFHKMAFCLPVDSDLSIRGAAETHIQAGRHLHWCSFVTTTDDFNAFSHIRVFTTHFDGTTGRYLHGVGIYHTYRTVLAPPPHFRPRYRLKQHHFIHSALGRSPSRCHSAFHFISLPLW